MDSQAKQGSFTQYMQRNMLWHDDRILASMADGAGWSVSKNYENIVRGNMDGRRLYPSLRLVTHPLDVGTGQSRESESWLGHHYQYKR
jgi:hypothetical protein